MSNREWRGINLVVRSDTETEKELVERDKALHEEILQRGRTFGAMVKFMDLITTFCSVCFVSSLDEVHKIKDAVGGEIYRAFNCGRRGLKYEYLRYEIFKEIRNLFYRNGFIRTILWKRNLFYKNGHIS